MSQQEKSNQQQQKQDILEQMNFEQQILKTSDVNYRLINQINITEKHVLLATKAGLYLINLKNQQSSQKKLLVHGQVWDAVFIPQTNYIAYSFNRKQINKTLHILDLKSQKIVSKLKIDRQIQQIKSSKNCIALSNQQEIFIVHFPTLKPLYNGPAGNNVHLIFDISFQGLTIAYNSFKRGELNIRNFTNTRRSNAITERIKSIYSQRMKPDSKKEEIERAYSSKLNEQKEFQVLIKVNAHNNMLSQIKISPNGSKVVTSGSKGTVLRIFSTKNGEKLEEFRVGYQIMSIADISFIQDGNMLACMNSKGFISLYNVSMDKEEIEIEQSRKGHKIYTQKNPQSLFSFLSFVYPALSDSYSFSYYQLVNPEFEEQQCNGNQLSYNLQYSFSKSGQSNNQKIANKFKKSYTYSRKQLQEENINDNQLESINQQSYLQNPLSNDLPRTIQNFNQREINQTNSTSNNNLSLIKQSSEFQLTNKQVPPSKNSLLQKRLSQRSKQQLRSKKNQKMLCLRKEKIDSVEKKANFERSFYNMVVKLHITQSNYIWAIKGYHIFGLKHDSFRGGEMVLDKTIKIE